MTEDIKLYKELVLFCNENANIIEPKFSRMLEFTSFNERCFEEMYFNIKDEDNPIPPKILKEKVDGLTECYKNLMPKFLNKRNQFIKGLDIQLGQWYEKAFKMFLESKGILLKKKGFPYPDFVVENEDGPVAYFELKYIEAPFVNANNVIKNTYPYTSKRFDYECSLTLDTGEKLKNQRRKIENEIIPLDIPAFYIWWFDAPHLKGVFYMNAIDVFNYWDNVGEVFERDKREGDYIDNQTKGKIYPPLLKMKSLSSLLVHLS